MQDGGTWTTTVDKSARIVALEAAIVVCSVMGGGYFSLPLACAVAAEAEFVRFACIWYSCAWVTVVESNSWQLVGVLLLSFTIYDREKQGRVGNHAN